MEHEKGLYESFANNLKGSNVGIDYDRMYSQIMTRSKSSETLHARLNYALAATFMFFLMTFSVFAGHFFFYGNNNSVANYILRDSNANSYLISSVFE